jgi:imidazolonepropionase-like amidohydrolase
MRRRSQSLDCARRVGNAEVSVDCHTHLVYAGNRVDEFEAALNGRDLHRDRRGRAAGSSPRFRATRRAAATTSSSRKAGLVSRALGAERS